MTKSCRDLISRNSKIKNLISNIDAKQAKKWRITAKSRDTDLGVKEKLINPVGDTTMFAKQTIHAVRKFMMYGINSR